jgi:hypothetical protein
MELYILDAEHRAVHCEALHKWTQWMAENKYHAVSAIDARGEPYHAGACRVGATMVRHRWVSTVFLGISLSWDLEQRGLFESKVFGAGGSQESAYPWNTWEEAEAGHQRIVSALMAGNELAVISA